MNLKSWLQKIDHHFVFSPSRWPHRELVSRATALIIIAVFLGLRLHRFDAFPGVLSDAQRFYGAIVSADGTHLYSNAKILLLWAIKLTVWLIETLIYLGYIASYASRVRVVSIAQGFMETAYPIIVAGTPVLISFLPYALPQWAPYTSQEHMTFYTLIMALIVAGGLINLAGLLTLRRAFSIMAEARTLITSGIFSYVRHPLYTGHFIMFFGSLLLRISWLSIILYLLFFVSQVIRARVEEHKMMGAFSDYATYRKRTGMFFPKIPWGGTRTPRKT